MTTPLRNSFWMRPTCFLSAFLMASISCPASLFAPDPKAPHKVDLTKPMPQSRLLTAKELKARRGKTTGNPYYAGQAKFDVVYKGIDTRTGNFSTSATDLSFEGGYGIPVNVTRSYSANSIDEGPLGYGWTLSVDLRSTAGGVLKGKSAPVRSIPTDVRRRPTTETDPNAPAQPTDAVTVTDAGGTDETIQRDADGLLTTPAWDKNQMNPVYETRTDASGNVYWLLLSNDALTPDGTTYHYAKMGTYVNGSLPWNNPSATPEPNNVLKVTSVTDRNSNVTTYTYNTGVWVNFNKANGLTQEHPLTGVSMPNGRTVTFNWAGNRIASATDGTRTVLYGYDASGIQMTSETSPGGRATLYAYSGNLLTGITDPRGQLTQIAYNVIANGAAQVSSVTDPSGAVSSANYQYGSGTQGFTSYTTATGLDTHALPALGVSYTQPANAPTTYVVATGSPVGQNNAVTAPIRQNTYNAASEDLSDASVWNPATTGYPLTDDAKTYNFLGSPLSDVVTEYSPNQSGTVVRTTTTQYGYWDQHKYFQQKVVRVDATAGSGPLATRYSYTDYYGDTAAQGSKGQTYEVFDPKYGNIIIDTSTQGVPGYAVTGGYAWKYQVRPSNAAQYSAQFAYDAKGRALTVQKLQSVDGGGAYHYVTTQSTYGADGAPAYGNATVVVEDSGGIGRTTQTLTFDVSGKAVDTVDAAGRQFHTSYDGDRNVLGVTRTDSGLNQTIVSYAYGSTNGAVENGQPTSVSDGLSGATQSIAYVQSGVNRGLPLSTSENDGGGQVSSVTYAYDSLGARTLATVVTPNGTNQTRYWGYATYDSGDQAKRVFSSMNRQSWNGSAWVDSGEQFDYAYDYMGRLSTAAFAETPQAGQSNYGSFKPASQALAAYSYDNAGRILSVLHYWQVLSGSSYLTTPVSGTSAVYAHPLGLKTETDFLNPSGSGFATARAETYSYDATLDYLTGVNYNDGLANASPVWTYDAAGNRSSDSTHSGSWTYDNLNRMTASPIGSYTNDILGNRSSGPGVSSYGWDLVNRMTSLTPTSGSATTYLYRADGMRVAKALGGVLSEQSFYDGQMPVETASYGNNNGSPLLTSVSRNAVGVRGVEAVFVASGSTTSTTYPLYDCHGNNIAAIAKSGTSSFVLGNQRTYDAWGGLRSGSGQKQGYCASIGHVHDIESGMIYMRARYYEPACGRFLTQDPRRDGKNWLAFAGCDPVNKADYSGQLPDWVWGAIGIIAILAEVITIVLACIIEAPLVFAIIIIVLAIIILADAIHFIKEITDGLRRPGGPFDPERWKREMRDNPTDIPQIIDEMKTNGGVFDRILACDLELVLYTAEASQ